MQDLRANCWLSRAGGEVTSALIFVHGYNCSTDWACMRLGQLITLGNFAPILPFVFSWPTGRIPSFFAVRRELLHYGHDLAEFLQGLRNAGMEELHLVAHSMGCELVVAALEHLEELPPLASVSFCISIRRTFRVSNYIDSMFSHTSFSL